jgi:hypothetical protein
MQTKLSQLQDLMTQGNWEKALAFAAKFPRLGAYRNAILDGHLACSNPRWIAGLGKDVKAVKKLGINALRNNYGI